MFVAHCVLVNIATYVAQQVEHARASWRHGCFQLRDPDRDNIKHDVIIWPNEKSKQGAVGELSTTAGSSWNPDDVPSDVRHAVYAADEQALGQVAGLTHVVRLPEGELLLRPHSSQSGRYLFDPVCS